MKNAKYFLLLFFCLSVVAGCGGGPKSVAETKDTNIKKVHAMYSFYMANNAYKGPESEEEFMAWMTSAEGRFAIKRMEMDPDRIDDYFVSERDGEKFVIRYGLKGLRDHAIVFEATGGEEGTRLVALGTPVEMDEDDYNDYLSGEVEGASGEGDMGGQNEEAAEEEVGGAAE